MDGFETSVEQRIHARLQVTVSGRERMGDATVGRIHEMLRKGLTKDGYDSVYSHDSPFFNTPVLDVRTLLKRAAL